MLSQSSSHLQAKETNSRDQQKPFIFFKQIQFSCIQKGVTGTWFAPCDNSSLSFNKYNVKSVLINEYRQYILSQKRTIGAFLTGNFWKFRNRNKKPDLTNITFPSNVVVFLLLTVCDFHHLRLLSFYKAFFY